MDKQTIVELEAQKAELIPQIALIDRKIINLKNAIKGVSNPSEEIKVKILRYLIGYTKLKEDLNQIEKKLKEYKKKMLLESLRQ